MNIRRQKELNKTNKKIENRQTKKKEENKREGDDDGKETGNVAKNDDGDEMLIV